MNGIVAIKDNLRSGGGGGGGGPPEGPGAKI